MSSLHDSHGVEILPTDHVMVTSYGLGARLVDTGTRSPVLRLLRKRVQISDSDGCPRAISPANLSVLRRDGVRGFEGNRKRKRKRERELSRDDLYRYARAIGEASRPACTCPDQGVTFVDQYAHDCPRHGANA